MVYVINDFNFCRCDSAVLSGVTLMLFACIVWLKLVSYVHTNYDMRMVATSVDKVGTNFLFGISSEGSELTFRIVFFLPRCEE